MGGLWIVVGVLVLATAALVIGGLRAGSKTDVYGRSLDDGKGMTLFVSGLALGVVTLILGIVVAWNTVMPEYRLYRAEVEKRILVEEARAQADADVERARGEIERARGTAEANRIVADSITEPYLRYLYIDAMKNTSNQVIYVPTEAGLPILEAGKR